MCPFFILCIWQFVRCQFVPVLIWVIFYVKWHDLSREEQAKYYEKARAERQKHMEMYPHWNARDNYRFGLKKKKRKRDKADDPGTKLFFLAFSSGIPWAKRNKPSTTHWPNGSAKCTCNCTQAGRPGTTMPSTKRNGEKGTKLEQTIMAAKVPFVRPSNVSVHFYILEMGPLICCILAV